MQPSGIFLKITVKFILEPTRDGNDLVRTKNKINLAQWYVGVKKIISTSATSTSVIPTTRERSEAATPAKTNCAVRPFFMGAILGQFASAGVWLVIDACTGMTDNRIFSW